MCRGYPGVTDGTLVPSEVLDDLTFRGWTPGVVEQ